MPKRSLLSIRRLLLLCSLLALGGCASMGDYGASGGGYPPPSESSRQTVSGTVQNVDHGNRRVLVLDDRDGRRFDLSYDRRTRLRYLGQERAVSGLEPGDRVRVQAARGDYGWYAIDFEVTQDARGGGADGSGALRGAVSFVDARAQVIGYTEGGYSGRESRVRYDARTRIEYRGESYRPGDLERGDLIRIEARPDGGGWLAERIMVEVDAGDR